MKNRSLIIISSTLLLTTMGILPGMAKETKSQSQFSQGLTQKNPQILLPEGFQISGRKAKLIQHPTDQRWFLKFQSTPSISSKLSANQASTDSLTSVDPNSNDPFTLPIEVLPCQWLTKMVSVSNKKTDLSITFRVWAEVTTYQNKNYLLPKDVYTLSLFGSQAQQTTANSASSLLDSSLSSPSKTLSSTSTNPADKFQLPSKLRQILMETPRPQPILITELNNNEDSSKTTTNRRSFTVGGTTRTDLRENYMVINRVGRIAYDPDERYWLFAFEADGQSLAEPPIALLPSQLLEIVEKTLQKTSQPAKFRISGQVTRYQNKNYLLLRKLLIVLDRGNLGK